MKTLVRKFWREEEGQDLIEYSLLIAFLAIASAGALQAMHGSISGIWSTSNTTLASAKTAAS